MVARAPGTPLPPRTNVQDHNIPRSLREIRRWACWKWIERDGDAQKLPINPVTGGAAKSNDSSTWSTFDTAFAYYKANKLMAGLMIAFVADDPLMGLDLDGCIDRHGFFARKALDIIAAMDSYSEFSPRGNGVKVFAYGDWSNSRHRTKNVQGFKELEVYSEGRFFTVTGDRVMGTSLEVEHRQRVLDDVSTGYFPSPVATVSRATAAQGFNGDDQSLLDKMFGARNGADVRRLWEGDASMHGNDDSAADMALASHLAFWAGRDADRMERLMRASALRREKWDQHHTYLRRTIDRAIAGCTEMYNDHGAASSPPGRDGDDEAGDDEKPVANDNRTRKSQATLIIEMVESDSSVELFHTPGGHDSEGYATVTINGRQETWAVGSRGFKRWVSRQFYVRHRAVPGSQAIADAVSVLAGKAIHEGVEREVHVRIARHEDAIWLDLVDDHGRAIKITSFGWEVVSSGIPVRFLRKRGMLALPVPMRGGSINELRRFVNLADDVAWVLAVAWLVGSFRPGRPLPMLVVNGEQGCCKSTLGKILRLLIDPAKAPLRRPPKDERDLAIAASNSWVVGYDNLSGISPSLSDALCSLSTGGGFGTRELYTDDDEKVFDALRPVILNGIDDVINRSDALDRALMLTLPVVPENRRRDEEDLWKDFELVRPRVLGAVLDAVSMGLLNFPATTLERMPRMADFARFIVAAEPALGWKPGTFLAAYTGNRDNAHVVAIESAPIGPPLLNFMQGRHEWCGTATELLAELGALEGSDRAKRPTDWPKSSRGLGTAVRRIAPNLRAMGFDVQFHEPSGHEKKRIITLRNTRAPQSAPSARPAGAPETESRPIRDAGDATVEDDDADGLVDERSALDELQTAIPASQKLFADDADGADHGLPPSADQNKPKWWKH